jgi:hypothetical protein
MQFRGFVVISFENKWIEYTEAFEGEIEIERVYNWISDSVGS